MKVIDKRLIASRDYVRKNLRREAVVLQKMKHTNIVQLYEVNDYTSIYNKLRFYGPTFIKKEVNSFQYIISRVT